MNRRVHLPHRLGRRLAPVLLLAAALPGNAEPLALAPDTACELLKPEGLQARGGYRKASGSTFRCASFRKALVSGGAAPHEIRFYAEGDEATVHELGLELNIRSREDVQRAHRTMWDYAAKLAERGLQTTLPPEIRDAVLSATNGAWTSDDREFELRRETLSAPGYELRLTIR